MKYDVAVVGGGVIGAFVARSLMRYELSVAVLEKSCDVASGASRANSGIAHAGFDAPAGSKKTYYNRLGSLAMEKTCGELGVPYRNNGSLVIARGREEEDKLKELLARGKDNGIEGLCLFSREEAFEKEPRLSKGVTGALYAKTGAIVCPYSLTVAAMGNAMDNGAALLCNFSLVEACRERDGWLLTAEDGRSVRARIVVNCAGYGAQAVSALFGDTSFQIGARKGEYILLDHGAGSFVNCTVFTVPTAAGKGVLVSPTVHGNLIVGPTSVEEKEYNVAIRREGFAEIIEKAGAMLDGIPFGETITSFAGVRAYCDRHDFIVEWSAQAEGLFNVAGIESPGLTGAPAIGQEVAKSVAERLHAGENKAFDPVRRPSDWFKKLSAEEKTEIIRQNPDYGKIVCRCEEVTLGEILEALRTNPRATTLDGIKLRTRAGMGRCQSGFCQPTVFNAIMREVGLRAEEVTKNGGASFVITGGDI